MTSDATATLSAGISRIAELTYLTSAEAAAVMRIAPSTLRVWRSNGLGPRWIKVGRRVLYREQDLLDYLAER